jgi:hypothetical protein
MATFLRMVHSIMMVFSAQLGGGGGARPSPFTLSNSKPPTWVASPSPPSCQRNLQDITTCILSHVALLTFSMVVGYKRRGIILQEANPMSGVFQNIDTPPPPPPPTARRVCTPPPLVWGDTLAGRRRGGRSIVRKTPDTALYSICVSTLWSQIWHTY